MLPFYMFACTDPRSARRISRSPAVPFLSRIPVPTKLLPKSHGINLLADNHPLTPIPSILYKNTGGRVATPNFRPLSPRPQSHYLPKSNRIISFADHHPLTLLESYRF